MPSGSERVLTPRELNRAVLARQLLLERARESLPRALERIGGIQAQYAPSMYVGLWSRLRDFERERLTRALERRTVVQGTLMRVTIHLVSAADYWPLAIGIREARRERWLRARPEVSPRKLRSAATKVRRLLAEGPRPRAELIEDIDTRLFNGVGVWLDLVRVPPAGTWERRPADIYATAESWLGESDVTPAQGLEHAIRRYLRGFGPAAPADIANWAGMPPRLVSEAVERMELRHFRDEQGGLLVDLPRLALPRADDPGAAALPADLGRHAARPLPARAGPPGGVQAAHLPLQGAAVVSDLHGRRRGRGDLAPRARPDQPRAVPKADPLGARAAGGGGGAAAGAAARLAAAVSARAS